MKVGGYTLHPTQVGGEVKGGTSPGGMPIQQQMYSNIVSDTIANTTLAIFSTAFALSPSFPYSKGGTFRLRFCGTASTTGTPTLELQVVFNTGANVLADSGAYTMPSGLSNGRWQIDSDLVLDESGNIGDIGTVFFMPVSVSPTFLASPQLGAQGSTTYSGSKIIALQVRWSAMSASNTISLVQAYMDYYPPGAHS